MTDAQTALAQVREALSAGPTPGPWHHCQPFQSVRAERTIHGPVPAQRVDFVSTKTQPVHERIIIPMAGKEAHVRSEDMMFIAACNPTNIAAILAHVEAQAAEIERLRKLLCQCDMRTRLVGDGCEFCNPQLADELAKEQIERLTAERDEARAERDAMAKDAERYRFLSCKGVPPYFHRCSRWRLEYWNGEWWDPLMKEELDAAIDAQIEQEKANGSR